jgi:hypothetical protein
MRKLFFQKTGKKLSRKKYKTIDELVKGHTHLQKTLGSEKIAIPKKGAPPEEIKAYLEKVGLPQKFDDYKFELDPKTPVVDKVFVDAYKKMAHDAGILPDQAKKQIEWFAKVNDDAFKAEALAAQEAINLGLKNLKAELGDAYNSEVIKAKAAMREFTSEDDRKVIKELGLGNNPMFIKLMAKAGGLLSESKLKGEGGSLDSGALSPAMAQARIKELQANGSPYWDSNHNDHLATKREVKQLFNMAYPSPDKHANNDI